MSWPDYQEMLESGIGKVGPYPQITRQGKLSFIRIICLLSRRAVRIVLGENLHKQPLKFGMQITP